MYFLEKTNTAIYKEIEEVLANSQKRRLKVGKHAKWDPDNVHTPCRRHVNKTLS